MRASSGRSSASGASHFGLAAADCGVARAPWSIHAVMIPISAAPSAGPPAGIRDSAGPVIRCTSRLAPLFPGFTAAPLRPPFSTSS